METSNILRRKAGVGRPPPEIVAMSPEKAMKLAFGRAGRGVPGLGLRMTGYAMERTALSTLPGLLPERALMTTLARADGAKGVLVLDPGMIGALIEAETMGRVNAGEPAERAPTRIDAVIVGSFFDQALSLFDEVAADLSIAGAVTGFRSGDLLPSVAAMTLVIEDRPLRLFRLGFDFADGKRQGQALLAMPFEPPRRADEGSDGGAFNREVEAMVMGTRAEVHAVLLRMALPLDAVARWEPGSLVPLARDVLAQVRLEDIDGKPLGGGRLGQMNGMRAVRIAED